MLLGKTFTRVAHTFTRLSRTLVRLPNLFNFAQPLSLVDQSTARSECSHNPQHATPVSYHTHQVWPLHAFARHYSRNHFCFLFLWVLRCFTSPRSLQHPYIFRVRSPDITPVSSRFPYSDIHGSQLVYQLPVAYRRLQRPSSALDAKASTDRP